ncbi:hypothetical protein WMY93_012387 [Mugilogobius chulae]|uniref:EGF-like domain-containing protein n=1 Tax=Mugilogobius chulae TaxID=88201 RepID=A0AAW0PAY0_9GOBI
MPCTCLQAWKEDPKMPVRTRSCPFTKNMEYVRPCRLEGELWPCVRTPGPAVCTEMKDLRHKLREDRWTQNSNRLWEKTNVFSELNLENHPCIMVQIEGMELGPFCYNNIDRWRWSLFAVGVILLLSVTLLITFCLRNFVKKSVWSCYHRGFVKIRKAHVLVLSPPDGDEEVSSTVCSLGSLLSSSGFSVNVDQWSRRGQLSLGPLPWTHCQLLSMNSPCERVLLVLTPRAVDRAHRWSKENSPVTDLHEESPYSDIFRACLFAIQAYRNQGRAEERFVLVAFDFQQTETNICHSKLPEILQGLPLFYFPSQMVEKSVWRLLCVLLNAAWLSCVLTTEERTCHPSCNKCSGPDQCAECGRGWLLHNGTCVDIDECDTKLGTCSADSYCLNKAGSYECKGCDAACVGCMGSGPARCRKCAPGYRLTGSKCLDIDECSDLVMACRGLDEICTNTEGSFHCDCAKGYIRKDSVCVKKHQPSEADKGLFEDIQDDEVVVLQQMFMGVLLCALGTLAAKGDLVYTSIFIGAIAAMAGYWLSDRGDRILDSFLKGR